MPAPGSLPETVPSTIAETAIALPACARILVPGGGVEPPRAEARRILSPLRLPVPPSRLIQLAAGAGALS